MLAYLKETGERLTVKYQHVEHVLPKGRYQVILRNTTQELALSDSWDGGEVEVTMVCIRKGRHLQLANRRHYSDIKWPDLRYGDVPWKVNVSGYKTSIFKYDLSVSERSPQYRSNLAGTEPRGEFSYAVSFLDSYLMVPSAPLSEVMPMALTWAKDIVDDLHAHMKTVTFSPGPRIVKNPRAVTRFEIMEENYG